MRALGYFLGDLAVCTAVGALAGVGCAAVFGEAWPMPLAMLVGMALGMVLAFAVASVIGGLWLGAFEVMAPSMLAGMAAGMVSSMRAAAGPVTVPDEAILGAELGAVAYLVTVVANLALRGEDRQWTN